MEAANEQNNFPQMIVKFQRELADKNQIFQKIYMVMQVPFAVAIVVKLSRKNNNMSNILV